jgi:LysR family transcriptional activator of glutamate synthase operon
MERINTEWLRTFLAVADRQHLGEAAEAIHTDQSTVSRRLASLEQEMGVELFERQGRRLKLSPAGERFVPRAERLLDELRDAIAEANEAQSAERGEIRLAFLNTVGAHWLPPRIAAFLGGHPGVRFTLKEAPASEIASGVVAGDFDLGIAGPPPTQSDLEVHELFAERVAVVVPKHHPLASQASCRLQDLANLPLILPRSRGGLRRVVDDAFAREGLSERVVYEGDDFSIVQGLVEAGLGVTLVPALAVSDDRLVAIPLTDPPIVRTMAICWAKRRLLHPTSREFADTLLKESAAGR